MRVVTAWLLLAALVSAACQRDRGGGGRRAEPPELAASGGKRVPDGFVTRFTGPDGQEVELGYTQVWAALHGGKMAIKLSAESGTLPGRSLNVYLDLSNRKPSRLEELEGAWLTALPPSADGFVYEPRAADRATRRRATSAAVSITTVSEDAVEGTFTADLGGGDTIADGSFRAARSDNLEPESLAALAQRSQ